MYLKKFKKKRFLVSKGEAMIFNSNLIHGNSFNLENTTRISIDFRLLEN